MTGKNLINRLPISLVKCFNATKLEIENKVCNGVSEEEAVISSFNSQFVKNNSECLYGPFKEEILEELREYASDRDNFSRYRTLG